jgi:hypothetical protein
MSLTTKKLFKKQNPQDGECPPWAQKLAVEYAKAKVKEVLEGVFQDGIITKDNYKEVYSIEFK